VARKEVPIMLSPSLRTTLIAAAIALLSAAALVVLARPAHAAGLVEVRFVEPERFGDAGRNPVERDRALVKLAAHLRELGRQLPDGQQLKVDVLDVDLAGEEVVRSGRDIRVLRGGADVPRLTLRWALQQGGSTLKSGEDRLTNLAYLNGAIPNTLSPGDLPYEKAMLTKWFRERVVAGGAQ
jgi:hypothetical protein